MEGCGPSSLRLASRPFILKYVYIYYASSNCLFRAQMDQSFLLSLQRIRYRGSHVKDFLYIKTYIPLGYN